mgnify:CR=1 FL=1
MSTNRWMLCISLLGFAPVASAIDLAYGASTPPFGVGFSHDLVVEGASLFESGGSPTSVGDFNFVFGILSGYAEATSSIATDIDAVGSGSHDEFFIVSPAGGAYRTEGRIGPPGGLYEAKNKEFTGLGHGPGALPGIWNVDILSTGEALGTPVEVNVTAIIQGSLFANQLTHTLKDDAFASWKVYSNSMMVIEGSSKIVDGPGSVSFHDDNLLSPLVFMSEVGGSFTVEVLYHLEVNGNTSLSNSIAEVTGSTVHVEATVVPEPSTIALVGLGLGYIGRSTRKRARRA